MPIRTHSDRTRGPQARAAAKARRAERVQRERIASAAERAYLALVAPKAAR
jgi:hypothetical protein